MNKGFTLVEIIVSVSIFSMLILIVSSMLVDIIQNPELQNQTLNSIDQARFVSSRFANEIRAAAFGTYPLVQAQDNEIIFYSPIGGNGNVNRIRYYLSGNALYKGIIIPVNGTYNPASETVSLLISNLSGGPIFTYYDGDYDNVENTEPLATPANVTQVKFVKINLSSSYNLTRQSSGQFSLSAGSAIRILKNNLTQ